MQPEGEFVTTWQQGPNYIASLNGIGWWDAEKPPRKHKCWIQTKAFFIESGMIYRCACSAISFNPTKYWAEKNGSRIAYESIGDTTFFGWLIGVGTVVIVLAITAIVIAFVSAPPS